MDLAYKSFQIPILNIILGTLSVIFSMAKDFIIGQVKIISWGFFRQGRKIKDTYTDVIDSNIWEE